MNEMPPEVSRDVGQIEDLIREAEQRYRHVCNPDGCGCYVSYRRALAAKLDNGVVED
jgi:hypothetical protein